jgi:hypothetical protein
VSLGVGRSGVMCLKVEGMLMMLIGFRMYYFSIITLNQAATGAIKYLYDIKDAIRDGKALER